LLLPQDSAVLLSHTQWYKEVIMRTLAMFAAVMLSMLFVLLIVDVYDSYFNQQPVAAALSNANAEYERSMKKLCETYRKWQALPEIAHQTTNMDAVCEKISE
jgi:hypothetical protein